MRFPGGSRSGAGDESPADGPAWLADLSEDESEPAQEVGSQEENEAPDAGRPPMRLPMLPFVIARRGRCEGNSDSSANLGKTGEFLSAAGDAAATAVAAAAAANAVAAQQRLDEQQRQRQVQQCREGEGSDGDDAEQRLFRAPPGLADSALLPSRGSGMHCSGDCSPCVWHWKPQGCFRGQECGYCHLCPEGEIKLRKKAKLATLRSGPRGLESEEGEKALPETPTAREPPSVGSLLHGSGECRPCAWFWKAQGCQNGRECRHCHLCPEGEIKLRKKLKVEVMRKDQLEEPSLTDEEEVEEPLKVLAKSGDAFGMAIAPPPGLDDEEEEEDDDDEDEGPPRGANLPPGLPSVGSLVHGSGECRPCAWFWKAQGCQNGRECRHCHLCPEGEIKARKKEKAESLRLEKQQEQPTPVHSQSEEPASELELQACSPCSPAGLPFLPLLPPMAPLPSIGSSLHGTGLCRPCAWFWKPQGCENGQECCHCHLCPSGEIKARRKMKVAVLRHQGTMQEPLELPEDITPWDNQWEVPGQVPGHAQGFFQEDESPESDASPAYSEAAGGLTPFLSPVPLDLSASLDSPLPSTGSALHSLGKCRPCAWFWKSKGCLNGQACAHCHLCPEGELKVRKKVKETAMRIGALMPARRGLDSRSPRVVKIAPVLGA